MKSLYELSQEIKATKPKEPYWANQKCPSRTDGRCCVTWDAATNTWICIFCYAGHKEPDPNNNHCLHQWEDTQ